MKKVLTDNFEKEVLESIQNVIEKLNLKNPKNIAAVNAYKKCDFVALNRHEKGGIVMLRRFF